MDSTIRVQILDEAVFLSLSAIAIGKGMNISILSSAMGK